MQASTLMVRVAKRRFETPDICSFELVALDGQKLPPFNAGAHIDVHVPGNPVLVRQYSLCNPPTERHRYLIGVQCERSGRGGSIGMHERVQEGDLLQISAPRQNFPLLPVKGAVTLVGGGIGLTPVLAMAWELHASGIPFNFHIGVRAAAHLAFRDAIERAPFAQRIVYHYSEATPPDFFDFPAHMAAAGPGDTFYVCGPGGMLAAAEQAAHQLDWAAGRLQIERFAKEEATGPSSDAPFEIELAKSGKIVIVAANQTAAQAIAAAGVEVPLSCEQGICGTCITRVLEGTPDHRDSFLLPDERNRNDQFLPCCSRSLSPRLVLDL